MDKTADSGSVNKSSILFGATNLILTKSKTQSGSPLSSPVKSKLMKKSLLLLLAILTASLWGCSEGVVSSIPTEIKLRITSSDTNILIDETGSFRVSTTNDLSSDITVEVVSDNTEVLTVPSSVTITSGTQEVSGAFSTIKEGKATITISCKAANVTIEEKSVEITVSEKITVLEEVYVPEEGTFIERLKGATIQGRPAVESVNKTTNSLPKLFPEGRYMIKFNQPLDHSDKSAGGFTQRVIVSIASTEKPVVFVTQGYGFGGGWSFEDPSYTEELTDILECNQIIVEHRFFEDSTPSNIDWKYQTLENEVNDLHLINLVMRKIFKDQKFISTGRSKGGQTAIYYEATFPKDIDIAVPYVAPICYQLNDRRHAEFLKNVGSESRRQKIKALQQEMFNRRAQLVPQFEQQNGNLNFNADIDVIFDLCVLEYSFMCWQHNPSSSIPDTNISDYALLSELSSKSGASYFASDYDPAFFVNVKHDIGYYGYDVTQFTNTVITQEQANRWVEDIVTPLYASNIEFNPAMGQKVKTFLQNNTTEKMIFIYGEYDTWSAAAVDKAFVGGKTNMFRYDCPGMDHSTLIRSFDSSTQKEIKDKIKAWLAE